MSALFIRRLPIFSARTSIHFLHIRKCAGTSIKRAITSINEEKNWNYITPHKHSVTLADIPEGSGYFFSTRSPVTRFYSGFYSRKRKGQPTTFREWSDDERKAFEYFPEANDLAESLFCGGNLGRKAIFAMRAIRHVRQHQVSWFPCIAAVFEDRPPLCILRQENLDEDFLYLKEVLKVRGDLALESDPVRGHRNDYGNKPRLSGDAVRNLEAWYAADCQFHRLAVEWIEENQTGLKPRFCDVNREIAVSLAL